MTLPFPVLLADVGGTNARFEVLHSTEGSTSGPIHIRTASVASPEVALRAALAQMGGQTPRSAILAIAGRVTGPTVQLTNAAWEIDAASIGRELALERVIITNDFVPIATCLLELCKPPASELVHVGPKEEFTLGTRVALGPGTGCGAAALVRAGDKHLVQTTEAGHVDFGAIDKWDFAVWPFLQQPRGRLEVETVLSGPGILRLYHALRASSGEAGVYTTPEQIIAAAKAGEDHIAEQVLRAFVRLLGRFAGDLALIFGATGGIFISGGIAPHIIEFLRQGDFREAFERKRPFEAELSKIPTCVITRQEPALLGLQILASQADHLFYDSYGWRSPKRIP
jgi:glucokinase